MIIGFKERFIKPILFEKTKKHTIREDKKNRWKAGMLMHMATGVRTKNYNCFKEVTCKSIQLIEIQNNSITVDNRKLTEQEIQQLIVNDGFDSTIDFWNWFEKPFKGKIIHWTDLRY